MFPFAVHFAEAIGTTIHALPRKQFLMRKPETRGSFAFVDLTGNYPETALLGQVQPREGQELKWERRRA